MSLTECWRWSLHLVSIVTSAVRSGAPLVFCSGMLLGCPGDLSFPGAEPSDSSLDNPAADNDFPRACPCAATEWCEPSLQRCLQRCEPPDTRSCPIATYKCEPKLGGGVCVECQGDGQCEGQPHKRCHDKIGRCVECKNDEHCSPLLPFCRANGSCAAQP